MTRAFRLTNADGDMIDLLADLDIFGVNPDGLGVSFEYTSNLASSNFLLEKSELKPNAFKISIAFGYLSQDPYNAFKKFVTLLNKPPYRLEYETPAGKWIRETRLSELTKSEIVSGNIMLEEFTLECFTPWFRDTNGGSPEIVDEPGDGKIYVHYTDIPNPSTNMHENLIDNSTILYNTNGWTTTGSNISVVDYSNNLNVKAFKLVTANGVISKVSLSKTLFSAEEYTISATFVGIADVSTGIGLGVVDNGDTQSNLAENLIKGETRRITYRWANTGSSKTTIDFGFLDNTGSGEVMITEFKLEQGRETPYTPSRSEGGYIEDTTKDLIYPKDYDYIYNKPRPPMIIPSMDYYIYDYVYEENYKGRNNVFEINNNSVYLGAQSGSPLEITIYGPAVNPYWEIVRGSEILASDGFNITIAEGYKLVVNSIPGQQKSILIDPEGKESLVYQQQRLELTNFVTAPLGRSNLVFFNSKKVKYRLREEMVIV